MARFLDQLDATEVTYRNDLALFLWGFACFFLLGVAAMTYVTVRDGAPAGYSTSFVATVLMAFWVSGLGLAAFAFNRPRISITIQPLGVLVAKQYPFSKTSRQVPHDQVASATLIETTDDESAPYFICRVELANGEAFDIAEGRSREDCEQVRATLNHALTRFRQNK
jgi:hypothetical protein